MNRMKTRLKHTHTDSKGPQMTDFTHQASGEAYLQDGQRIDACKEFPAEYNYLILVYSSTDNEVCIHILRRGGTKTNQVKLIDLLRPMFALKPIYYSSFYFHSLHNV
jgi:hypothetical protein